MNNILAYDEEFILYMYPFLTILFFLPIRMNSLFSSPSPAPEV